MTSKEAAPSQAISAKYVGPYERWNFGYGRPFAFPGLRNWKYLTALTEIPKRANVVHVANGGVSKIWFPTLWKETGPNVDLTFAPFVIENTDDQIPILEGLISLLEGVIPQLVSFLTNTLGILDISKPRFRLAFPVPDCAMHNCMTQLPADPHPRQELPPGDGTRQITVIALIDDGLPFAHRNFRNANGNTRVEYCWLQSVEKCESQNTVLFGREYDRAEIDALIRNHGDDEDTLYRAAGATLNTEEFPFLARHATHGAHVMDLATGYAPERKDRTPDEIRIIAVQLPNTIAFDTSGFGKDMYMLSAFHYVFNRADIIAQRYGAKNLRLVINFSYGFSGGPHDGGLELEAAIDELIEARRRRQARSDDSLFGPSPTALVLPSGNTFLERTHGVIPPPSEDEEPLEVRWRLQPNGRTPSYLELWFGKSFDPVGYVVDVWDPGNTLRKSLTFTREDTVQNGEGDQIKPGDIYQGDIAVVGQVSFDLHRGNRWRLLVVLGPTEPEPVCVPPVMSGEWRVVIRRGPQAGSINEPVHCWIQRAADPESLRSGSRQSYFDDAGNIRYTRRGDLREADSPGAFVRRFGSLNGIATGATSLVVGGYRLGQGLGSSLKDARPSRYSSAGSRDQDWQLGRVDCSSMSDRSRVLPGTIAAGVRSGSRSHLQGTSAAAPLVARQLAEIFSTAPDEDIRRAERENYLPLLHDKYPSDPAPLTGVRLGKVLVPPHQQPGIEPISSR
ncbi:hypothetical protein BRADO1250 [Bradyrhizobium sp. ORS 278]|uniref:hypothetical protein n=1 Tax=Bradyrhizobium sp. (strain ORS 278) TaxID=114615 RepID=UPI0001507C88|nr:hypothetical protein [Bradyrhizobium sp. ORS 278]CAL75153.1 hypothetical protein BRADO1250 [Bradyrhizobium sp. ORS 278]